MDAVGDDIRKSEMRMIYENPSAYAEWRLRMGMDRPLEAVVNPAMKARVGALFAELAKSLEPQSTKRRPNYRPIEELADYARAPLTVSEEMAGFVRDRSI